MFFVGRQLLRQACIALAIAPLAGAVQSQAQPATSTPAQPPSAQSSPVTPAQAQMPPAQPQANPPKGLLDDAPAKPGQMVVIPGRDGAPAKPSDPAGGVPQPIVTPQVSQPPVATPPTPGVAE